MFKKKTEVSSFYKNIFIADIYPYIFYQNNEKKLG